MATAKLASSPASKKPSILQPLFEGGDRVLKTLEAGGFLGIDRPVPFLYVYRSRPGGIDEGLAHALRGETAHAVLSLPESEPAPLWLAELIAKMSKRFGAFLLVELWPAHELEATVDVDVGPDLVQPVFTVLSPKTQGTPTTRDRLEWALQRIRLHRRAASVSAQSVDEVAPPGFDPLFPAARLKRWNCHVLGLAVRPVYQTRGSGDALPTVSRPFKRSLTRALRRATFHFVRRYTNYQPQHYFALGPRRVLKSVWTIDRQLAEIDGTFDFLLQVTPINIDVVWNRFRRSKFKEAPKFLYRPLPFDPAAIKRRLYEIRIERVDDPALDALFRAKRGELDRKLTMLAELNTQRFRYGSFQLYGAPTKSLLETAESILRDVPAEPTEGSRLSAERFAHMARELVAHYRTQYDQVDSTVHVREDITGLTVSRGHLFVGKKAEIPRARAAALLAHEIGTHVVTYWNGAAQPFSQLRAGLPGYDALQEGIAVVSEYLAGGLNRSRIRLLAGRVLAAHNLLQGATFLECFAALLSKGFTERASYTITARIYRGGGLIKDAIYLRGLVEVLEFLGEGQNLESLFSGKFALEHLPLVEEMRFRDILAEPPLRPLHLQTDGARAKLADLAAGRTVFDLL